GHQAQLAVGLGTGGDVLQRSFDALIDDGHTQGKLAGLGIGVVVGNGHVLTILCALGDSFPVLFGKEIGPVYGAFVRVCVYVEHARQNGTDAQKDAGFVQGEHADRGQQVVGHEFVTGAQGFAAVFSQAFTHGQGHHQVGEQEGDDTVEVLYKAGATKGHQKDG